METAGPVDASDPLQRLSMFGEFSVRDELEARGSRGSSSPVDRSIDRVLQTPKGDLAFTQLGYHELFEKDAKWLKDLRPGVLVPPVEVCFQRAKELGLHMREVICVENGTGRFLCGGAKNLADRVIIPIDGRLYPICTQGLNRSQNLYRVALRQLKEAGHEETVQLPHGAVRGYDDFFTEKLALAEDEDPLQDIEDNTVVEVERVERFGFGMSKEEFEVKYWYEMIASGSTIVSIGKAAHAILHRLVVVAEKYELNLKRVHFQPFARTDPYHTKDPIEKGKKVYFFLRGVNQFQFHRREDQPYE